MAARKSKAQRHTAIASSIAASATSSSPIGNPQQPKREGKKKKKKKKNKQSASAAAESQLQPTVTAQPAVPLAIIGALPPSLPTSLAQPFSGGLQAAAAAPNIQVQFPLRATAMGAFNPQAAPFLPPGVNAPLTTNDHNLFMSYVNNSANTPQGFQPHLNPFAMTQPLQKTPAQLTWEQGSFLPKKPPTQPSSSTQRPQTNPEPRRPGRPGRPGRHPAGRDVIVPPSAASGGVPSPTQAYLIRASFAPRRLPSPRPILVVLDLNGTLLFRPNKARPKSFIARPHAATFVSYILSRFWVAVWSSAKPENVSAMIDSLLEDPATQRRRLVAIWGRDKFGLTQEDYSRRVWCYKRLHRLWDDPAVAASHPAFASNGIRWGQGDTVLVDDSVEKARSEPHSLLCIPEFAGDINESPQVIPEVHDYINELSYQSDVSTYIRENPFKMG